MDWYKWGMAGLALTLPVVLWDLFSRRPRGPGDPHANWVQTAWLVMLVCAFGLLLKITGFSEILLLACILTGLVVLWDWSRRGKKEARKIETAWLEISRSFFPVILVVFVVRSFLYEPFKIPSGSMIPTLLVGDFILVNKFTYGIRLPVTNEVVIPVSKPQRGDVVVFKYPEDPSTDYVKRLIGLPGDTVMYEGKRLTINGIPVPTTPDGSFGYVEDGLNYANFEQWKEKMGSAEHHVINLGEQPPVFLDEVHHFPDRSDCHYDDGGFTCKVPEGHYFMMGDNRDRSSDSRYWGFVPEKNLVGKAQVIWMNFRDFKRVGTVIH